MPMRLMITSIVGMFLSSPGFAKPTDFAGRFQLRDIPETKLNIEVTPLKADQSAFTIKLFYAADSGGEGLLKFSGTVDPSSNACQSPNEWNCQVCTYEEKGYDVKPSDGPYETIKCKTYDGYMNVREDQFAMSPKDPFEPFRVWYRTDFQSKLYNLERVRK